MSGDFRLHQMLKNDYHICTFVTLFRFITMLCGTDIIMWNIPYIHGPLYVVLCVQRDFLSILFLNFLAEQEAINLVTTKVNSVKAIILHFILHKLDKLLVSSRPIPSSLSCMHTKFEVKPTHTQRISSSLLSLSRGVHPMLRLGTTWVRTFDPPMYVLKNHLKIVKQIWSC